MEDKNEKTKLFLLIAAGTDVGVTVVVAGVVGWVVEVGGVEDVGGWVVEVVGVEDVPQPPRIRLKATMVTIVKKSNFFFISSPLLL